MNKTKNILIIGFLIQNLVCYSQQVDFSNLKGLYLGQKTPGTTAQLFAPGIVSTQYFEHSSPVFTPDLKEIYWSTQIEINGNDVTKPILFMKMINGVWTKPEAISFSKRWPCTENPFISPNGLKLFFMASDSIRPVTADIWYVKRTKGGWSEPINLGEPVNSPDRYEGQPTVSRTETLYFAGHSDGISYSKLINGKYQQPIFMDGEFYSHETDWTPYIAPDESYFIFSSFRKGGFGSGDLYISFKQKEGTWGKVINMGKEINTEANERFPNVTPDGKYFFFNSTRKIRGANSNSPGNGQGDIYWIDAKIIEELRP